MLSDQLRQARGRAGLSIYALAHQSGVGVASISEIESGKNKNPGLLTVAKLADVLDVSLDTLAERTSPRRRRGKGASQARAEVVRALAAAAEEA